MTENTPPPVEKMDKLSAEDVKKYTTDELTEFLRTQNLGLSQRDLLEVGNEGIDGETFLLLTGDALRNGLKFDVGKAVRIENLIQKLKTNIPQTSNNDLIQSQLKEEGNVNVNEDFLQSFNSILNISGNSTDTSDANDTSTSTSTNLPQMCKDGVIKVDDRLYYQRHFKPSSGIPPFTISQLCRVIHIDERYMEVTTVIDGVEIKSEPLKDLKSLESWIIELREVEKKWLPLGRLRETSKKVFLIRPLGTLYDLKKKIA